MLKVNLKKLKPYGDRLDDGIVQLSFTLPVSASPEAKEAARRYLEKLGFEKISVATMEAMGQGFSYFVAYAAAKESIDFTKVHVPKVEIPQMDYAGLKDYMARHLEEPIVVIGAATGADAHTVGIDAIMNMKGYGGDYGLERYPLFKAVNLRSQLTNEQLIEKAIELKADAILISQVVTQRDSHLKNLKEFKSLLQREKRLQKHVMMIIGGPRLDHPMALKLGFDAGFGPGTKPSQVASFIVHTYMKRHGIKERQAEVKAKAEVKTKVEAEHRGAAERKGEERMAHAPHQAHRHHEHRPAASTPPPVPRATEPRAEAPSPGEATANPEPGAHKKRRRRGRRGGRRHRRGGRHGAAPSGQTTPSGA
jgi:beta-lysine 5,6-aminomutase beta subunit